MPGFCLLYLYIKKWIKEINVTKTNFGKTTHPRLQKIVSRVVEMGLDMENGLESGVMFCQDSDLWLFLLH